MTPVDEWISLSWKRFSERWWPILGASGAAAAATLLGLFVPGLLGVGAASLGRWPVWAVSGTAAVAALLLVAWLSTWAQAAAIEAAAGEGDIPSALASSWAKTGAFAWTLSLVLLAAGGGFFLFLLPGLWLTPLLFLAPFYTLSEGVGGLDALELSWRRVSGRWAAVSGRLLVAGLLPFAVGLIPILGWLLGFVAGPFSLVMLAVLAEQLRATDPGPQRPAPKLGAAVAALSAVFLAASYFTVKAALVAAASLKDLLAAQVQ
jgi:hypothetical protein